MDYLRNTWYLAAWSDDIKPGALVPRTLLDRPLMFFRDQKGAVIAFDDRCPHRFTPLSRGTLDHDRVRCGYHGLEFDTDGVCVRNPHGQGKIPRAARVRRYRVVERYGAVWYWAGDEEPDEAAIPDFSLLEDDSYVTRREHMVMDVPYDLIIDNLLDCSHVIFLHDGILGNADMLPSPTEVVQDGDSIRVIRWARSVRPHKMMDMLFHDDGEPVDSWSDFRWDPPSHLLLDAGITMPGRAKSQGTGYFGTHILTPESASTTHYFTAASRWGIQPGTDTEEMLLKVSDLRRYAFQEQDQPMIRAQDRNIRAFADEESKPVMLETDAGVVRWRRILDGLVAAEKTRSAEAVSELRG